MLATVLSCVGGAAIASSWGGFGSYQDGYRLFYDRLSSYTREYSRDYDRYSRYTIYSGYNLEFCGCGDYWTEDCREEEHNKPGETPEVPLPAAGFLLLGAMGSVVALKRNKK